MSNLHFVGSPQHLLALKLNVALLMLLGMEDARLRDSCRLHTKY